MIEIMLGVLPTVWLSSMTTDTLRELDADSFNLLDLFQWKILVFNISLLNTDD